MENIQPIKRCKQLAALSREHHDGLLFVWKLRQGLNNLTNIEILRSYCNWYYKHHVVPHFKQEEDILLKFLSNDDRLAIQLKTEHNEIRDLLISVDRAADAPTIRMLADFVERHIRFEERIFFDYLEKTLSVQQLEAISSQLEIEPVPAGEWKEVFWALPK